MRNKPNLLVLGPKTTIACRDGGVSEGDGVPASMAAVWEKALHGERIEGLIGACGDGRGVPLPGVTIWFDAKAF